MKLLVNDYSANAELADAIRRYYTLLQMTFSSNVYKIFETPLSQIFRMDIVQVPNIFGPSAPPQGLPGVLAAGIEAQVGCRKCGTTFAVQARVDPRVPIKPGMIQLRPDGRVQCPGPNCTEVHDLTSSDINVVDDVGDRAVDQRQGSGDSGRACGDDGRLGHDIDRRSPARQSRRASDEIWSLEGGLVHKVT